MKIISLQSNNIKRLTAVNITPEGNVIQITGKNGDGKSSVLDSIEMVLGGKIPEKPIHKGQDKAKIVADLGDLIVTRTFTSKGSYLKVETADGAEYKSPQKMLDDLVGKLSFDPMDFVRMKEKDQFNTLAEYAGIDLSEIDASYKEKFTERTAVNKEATAKKKELDAMVLVAGTFPKEEVQSSDLVNEIQGGIESNRVIQEEMNLVNRSELRLKEVQQNLESKKAELKEAEIKLIEADATMINMRADLKAKEKDIVDVDALNARLSTINETNTNIRQHKAHADLYELLTVTKQEAEKLTGELKDIETSRGETIAKAKMPIDGLGFGDSVVNYNNIPLSQASTAEQIRVTVAIAMAMNPKLRIIRIKDGSLLDSDSMAIIDEMATKHDYQFWVERVDEVGEVGIMIEDGHIKSIDGVDYKEPETVIEPSDKSAKTKPKAKKKPEIDLIEASKAGLKKAGVAAKAVIDESIVEAMTDIKADQVSEEKQTEMKDNSAEPLEINEIKKTVEPVKKITPQAF